MEELLAEGARVKIKNTMYYNDCVGTVIPNPSDLNNWWDYHVILDDTPYGKDRIIGATRDQVEVVEEVPC
jgi:hypothetical protein